MENNKTKKGLDVIIAGSFILMVAAGLYTAVRAYVFDRAEHDIENVMLSQRGLHHYIQRVMHPTFFKAIDNGYIDKNFYTPEIFSSTYVVRTMHGFYKEELAKHGKGEILYKLAAENPRNPVNEATTHDRDLINLFNNNRSITSHRDVTEIDGKKYLHYAIPFMENSQTCLRCHSRREDAPPGLQALYPGDGGFNEELGRIRAIESIYAPLDQEFVFLYISYALVAVTACTILGLYLFSHRLRVRVADQTSELRRELQIRKEAEQNLLVQTETLEREIAERRRNQEALLLAQQGAIASNRALRLLSAGNRSLLRSTIETDQLLQVCRIAVEIGGYNVAWVGIARHDEEKSITPIAWFGTKKSNFAQIRMSWGDGERGASAMGTAIRTGTIQLRQDILNDPDLAPWHERAREWNHQSAIALPLWVQGKVFGALAIYAPEPHAFQHDEVELLTELADDLAFGIQSIRIRNAHEKALVHVRQLAYFDRLTGLPNRFMFLEHLEQMVNGDADGRQAFSLLRLDLNHLREINETHGHDLGDQVVARVAQQLREVCDQDCFVARFGGNDFTIVCLGDNQFEAVNLGERILASICSPFYLSAQRLTIGGNIGMVAFPEDGGSVSELLSKVALAASRATEAGGGFCFYRPEMGEYLARTMTLASRLEEAMQEENSLEMFYQAKVDLLSGRVIGAEALLRWHDPELGWISPAEFVPIAESRGMMIELGNWVLRAVCGNIRQWREEGVTDCGRVAVNISAKQIEAPNFLAAITKILEETGVPVECLELELTESVLMTDPEKVNDILRSLKSLGFTLALDDFGTGYSSLAYLQSFPLDTLKIDRAFVRDMLENKNDRSIVATIIAMAQQLGLNTVAEGIEEEGQRVALQQLGCLQAQGFHFSRPEPADEFFRNRLTGRASGDA